jgi:AcrR family transcriptional regulator
MADAGQADGRVDGRTARAQRTRAAIVEAHLRLIEAGDLRPTGERIAEAAGVSLRTLWTSFKDLETLFAASGERVFALMYADHETIPADLPRAVRVQRFTRQRVRELEILSPAARAAVVREPFSAQLRRNRSAYLARLRAEVTQVFASEIGAAGPDGDQLTDALVASSSFAVWNVLRDQLGLTEQGAAEVMLRCLTGLLGTSPS